MDLIDQYSIIIGLFCGFMLALALVNLFSFITTKKPILAVHSCYVIFLSLSLISLNGFGNQYIWQQIPWLGQHALAIFVNLSAVLSIIFFNELLDVKSYHANFSRLLRVISTYYLFCAVASLFTHLPVLFSTFGVVLMLSWTFVYVLNIWLWFKGQAIARLYALSSTLLFLCVWLAFLDNLNFLKLDFRTDYLLVMAAVIQALMLTLVLTIQHNRQQTEKFALQSQLLSKTLYDKNAQDKMLAQHEAAQEDLEYKMQERNLELEIALRELSDTNRELQEKNTLDALTGVRNRSYFDKKYIAEIRRSRREQTQLSIVMIDIDHFKSVNDKYGHLVGDDCIKAVALTIKNALKRPSDDLCRYGGEEFVLILPSTELSGASTLVENIRETIEQTPIHSDGFVISLTISAGIATAIAKPEQAEKTILAAADQQLYQAKNAGRNNVKSIFLSDSDEQIQD